MAACFTFIDLFAGIGGFRLAMERLGGRCVFSCEIDPHARATYTANFDLSDETFAQDITQVDVNRDVPNHDMLCAGFPCQPFSQSGHKRGFSDTRGTLFFNIAEIIALKRPKTIFLENVRHLLNHDGGRTFARIKDVIENELGYRFYYKVIKASDFGLPQHRPRLFIVGVRSDIEGDFVFPDPIPLKLTMSDILGGACPREMGYTLRVGGKASGIHDRRNWDTYLVDGEPHRLTVEEAKAMQGFPGNFKFPVSNAQSMKQLGNSVAAPAIEAVGRVLCQLAADGFEPPTSCV